MRKSPAHVIRQLLVDLGEGYMPPTGSGWPAYVNSLPLEGDKAIVVYNMNGRFEGRYMSDGHTVEHPQVQISVRGNDDTEALEKLGQIMETIDGVVRQTVTIDGYGYLVQGIHRRTGILAFGEEPERQRNVAAFNALTTIEEI